MLGIPNADSGAEADTFRDNIGEYNSKITRDEFMPDTGDTVIEYITAEGDPPFAMYRLTLEPIASYSAEEYEYLKAVETESSASEHDAN